MILLSELDPVFRHTDMMADGGSGRTDILGSQNDYLDSSGMYNKLQKKSLQKARIIFQRYKIDNDVFEFNIPYFLRSSKN